ncbi:hypothetical protein cypCar_00024327 [Cyprinus carpio]|nr:hypothetical protein cypCar_00024327 [Cyprinus carpio]
MKAKDVSDGGDEDHQELLKASMARRLSVLQSSRCVYSLEKSSAGIRTHPQSPPPYWPSTNLLVIFVPTIRDIFGFIASSAVTLLIFILPASVLPAVVQEPYPSDHLEQISMLA